MKVRTARWWIGAAAIAGACSSAAMADTTEVQELRRELSALKAEVTALRADRNQSWMNERRAEEVKALVREVLADADARASLLEGGLTAGHNGKNFFLASEDGSFLMNISGHIQFRYIFNSRDISDDTDPDDVGDAGGGADEGEAGFQIRRAKVQFFGHIGNPRLEYAIQFLINRADNSVGSDKVRIGYKFDDHLAIWVGEDTAPFLREELISARRQLAVERSLLNEIFTVDKVQGVGLEWSGDSVRLAAMVHDGGHSGDGGTSVYMGDFLENADRDTNKDFQDDAADYALTGRVDVKLAGDWGQWSDFTSRPGEELAVFVGGAVHWEVGETGDTYDNNEVLAWTLDASVEVGGFNAFVAYVGTEIDNELGDDYSPWGLIVQGGYNIDLGNRQSIEPFVRYEWIDLDDAITNDDGDAIDDLSIVTVGVNYYWTRHNAKLTLDVVLPQDSLNNVPGVSDGMGLLQDGPGDDGQVAVRAQFQLLF